MYLNTRRYAAIRGATRDHEISRTGRTGHLLTFPPSHLPFVKPAKRAFSCAAKAAFRVRRQDETRRVATEISRRPRQRLEAGRGIDGANRRQAIRPAAGFVVARSASPPTKFLEPKFPSSQLNSQACANSICSIWFVNATAAAWRAPAAGGGGTSPSTRSE